MDSSMAILLEPKVILVPLLINMIVDTLMRLLKNRPLAKRYKEERIYFYKLFVMILATICAYYHSLHHELITESLYTDIALWMFLSVVIYDYGYARIATAFEEKVVGRILGMIGVKK